MLCSIIVVVIICILTLSYSLPVFLMHRSIHVHRDKDNLFVFIVICWKWFCKLEQIVFVCMCVCLRGDCVFLNLAHRCWEHHTQRYLIYCSVYLPICLAWQDCREFSGAASFWKQVWVCVCVYVIHRVCGMHACFRSLCNITVSESPREDIVLRWSVICLSVSEL